MIFSLTCLSSPDPFSWRRRTSVSASMAPCSYASSDLESDSPRFSDASLSLSASEFAPETRLRGLRWRVFLGVLPACPASIESLRRAAANGRRRYAELRRRLIVDPHMMEDVQKADRLSVDNPLSQDPESVWGRFFKNADLQRTIESDLALLYPEHESFFQSFGCQAMLERILLVWALVHPQYGYKQGVHELLAPLVHVLRMDVTHLSQVRQRYEDPFEDRFDAPLWDNFSCSTEGRQMAASFPAHSSPESGDEDWIGRVHPEDSAFLEPDDLGFNLKTMLLGSDSYGAEGELGALLSGRFVEHDAYCMFDALLRGQSGAVALADYYNEIRSIGGLSPVLEASATVYHALATVDMPLYIHLSGLGVEPQFFALRWLRVLFSREFDLEKLLLLWDAMFAAPTSAIATGGSEENSDLPLGSFITCFALSILLHLRPRLLAASNATSCLQKLLCLPKNADIRNLIENAKTLQSLAQADVRILPSPIAKSGWIFGSSRGGKSKSGSRSPILSSPVPAANRGLQHHCTASPEMITIPESYWEERWMSSVIPDVLREECCDVQNMEEDGQDTLSGHSSSFSTGDTKTNQAKGSDYSNRSSNAHRTDVSNKTAIRRLLTGLAHRTAAFLHPEDKKGDISSPGSPLGSEASTKSEAITNDTDNNSASPAGAPFRGVNSEVAEIDPLRSHDVDLLCQCRGDSAAQACDASTHLLEGALCQGQLISSDFQDEIQNSQLQEKSNGMAKLPDSSVDIAIKSKLGSRSSEKNEYGVTTNNKNGENAESLMKIINKCAATGNSREKGSRTVLQTLGHSMAENIQVIESALTHRSRCSKDGGAAAASRGKSELFSKPFLNGKAHVTALLALAELRTISSLLLQM